jgi:type III secretion protein F
MATTGSIAANAGLNFDFINNSVAQVVQTKETELRNLIANVGPNPTTADLLSMQQQIQQWTLTTQVQSTVVKEIADALKGIVQKAG